jgi:Fe-S-cluster containining protein
MQEPLHTRVGENSGVEAGDRQLIQIIDAALADAARRSGDWLVCRPGCTQCCVGAFAISQLDARRLQAGLSELFAADAERAARVRQRATAYIATFATEFPGDALTGVLGETAEAEAAFEEFANDEPCPVLDPATGTCDLYAARPMTCRAFGPPIRSSDQSEEGLGVCELCFHGATAEQIAACEMEVDPDNLESALLQQLQTETGAHGQTIVSYALISSSDGQVPAGQ